MYRPRSGQHHPPSPNAAIVSQDHIDDLRFTVDHVEAVTGAISRWNGILRASNRRDPWGNPVHYGAKAWTSEILIHEDILEDRGMYLHTMAHEAFHSVSAGITPADFIANKGWEEGVVEKLARMTAPRLGRALPVPAVVTHHGSYPEHLQNLEVLRGYTTMTEEAFYLGLINTRLLDRSATVEQWIRVHTIDPRAVRSRLRSLAVRSARLRR